MAEGRRTLGVEGLRTGEGRCLCLARVRRRVRQYIHILNEEDKPRRSRHVQPHWTNAEEARAARRTQIPSTASAVGGCPHPAQRPEHADALAGVGAVN